MSIVTDEPVEHFSSPDDNCEEIITELCSLVQVTHPNPSIRFMIFEFTSTNIGSALKDAYKRGVSVGGLVCYRQALGPAERAFLSDLWASTERSL